MPRLMRVFLSLPLFVAAGLLLVVESSSSSDNPVIQLSIEGVIGPATDDYIERALESAARRHAELVVIRMDTPGGLDTSMRGIIKSITTSPVPVASYVAPTGARAASAGTYILYASHIAAMAPGTNVGAATPIRIGGLPQPDSKRKDEQDKTTGAAAPDAGSKKMINDAVAYLRSLAELRGRNQEWAEKAVREAASIPASEALKLNVIDIVATGMADLMKQVNGREVTVLGQKRVLQTTGSVIDQLTPDWRSRFLSIITNPNVAYILMLIGIYGLILEFSNPGAIAPGTVGAISLLLALYAFQLLPVNYAGMGLILLGIALMVGEAFQPSFGVLGIGGLIAFIVGSVFLMDTDVPGFGIDISVIVTFAIISALVFIVVIGMAIKARRRPVVSGLEELVGAKATVLSDFDHQGRVSLHSESWQALSSVPLHKGQQVKVSGIEGLTLRVEPLETPIQEEAS
ncbi:membrane-bound serine protease (ClpP class) [Thiogranum longum]|uniref:Membrane-bound serine protease (ClpP class) n=1 Tax=Thiogranum longum TaxID=1537524 RepID=A0A4R1HH64_9GAMM|nr:nodulation protein NfeD [Thiogranum longum]TCK18709.1 membrane-bound serine protease (ClpP class) [Thiogranum longum]